MNHASFHSRKKRYRPSFPLTYRGLFQNRRTVGRSLRQNRSRHPRICGKGKVRCRRQRIRQERKSRQGGENMGVYVEQRVEGNTTDGVLIMKRNYGKI